MFVRRSLAVLALAVCAASCGDDGPPPVAAAGGSVTPASSSSTTSGVSSSSGPAPTTSTPPAAGGEVMTSTSGAPTMAPSTTVPPTDPPRPPYSATIAVIDDATRARMTYSWRPGCPVPLEDLRLLTLPHWDDAGQSVTGELVVHADVADSVVEVFRQLYEQGFPIARMELVDVYQADDQASMRANNTSAFNCREVDGRPGTWSQHSYGQAVDVNPLVNPWVRGDQVDPPEGASYADRSVPVPGGIYAGDPVVQAFASVGWKWGGNWSGSKDYQHFSANGR